MPGNSSNIHTFYIADGFYEDCEELIHRCLLLEPLNFLTFCMLWKDMKFRCIYQHRKHSAEIAELSEEVVFIAKKFMLTDSSNLKESIAGLYLVYALLTQQPFANFAWLRIVPEDVPKVKNLEAAIRENKKMDALYILGTVLIKHTHYCVVERDRGIDFPLKKYFDGTVITESFSLPAGIFKRQNEEPTMIKELGTIVRRYVNSRDEVLAHENGASKMRYVTGNLPSQLASSFRKILNGMSVDDISLENRSTTVQSIKSRAMTNAVGSSSHLMTIEERKLKNSPQKKASVSPSKKEKKHRTRPPLPSKFFADLYVKDETEPKAIENESSKDKSHENGSNSDSSDEIPSLDCVKIIPVIEETSSIEGTDSDKSKIKKVKDLPVINETKDEDTESSSKNKNKISQTKPRKKSQGKRNESKPIVIETTDSESDSKPAKLQKPHIDKIPGVLESQDGDVECEIEIRDYATNKKLPVQQVLENVFKTGDAKKTYNRKTKKK